jgi:hypothetical protein
VLNILRDVYHCSLQYLSGAPPMQSCVPVGYSSLPIQTVSLEVTIYLALISHGTNTIAKAVKILLWIIVILRVGLKNWCENKSNVISLMLKWNPGCWTEYRRYGHPELTESACILLLLALHETLFTINGKNAIQSKDGMKLRKQRNKRQFTRAVSRQWKLYSFENEFNGELFEHLTEWFF